MVGRANGETTTISDDFTIGFPMGITVRTSDRIAFDLELVANIQNEPLETSLTVHPGVIVGLATVLRAVFVSPSTSTGPHGVSHR